MLLFNSLSLRQWHPLITLILFLPACTKKNTPTELPLPAKQAKKPSSRVVKKTKHRIAKAELFYERASQVYTTDLALLTPEENTKSPNQDLKKLVLVKHNIFNKEKRKKKIKLNPYKQTPFLCYKAALDDTIFVLEKQLDKITRSAPDAHPPIIAKTEHLLAQLEQLNQAILFCDEYHQELLVHGSSSGLTSGLFKLGFAGLSAGVSKGVGALL